MSYPDLASAVVRVFERIPTVVWAVWILAVIAGTGFIALSGGPLS